MDASSVQSSSSPSVRVVDDDYVEVLSVPPFAAAPPPSLPSASMRNSSSTGVNPAPAPPPSASSSAFDAIYDDADYSASLNRAVGRRSPFVLVAALDLLQPQQQQQQPRVEWSQNHGSGNAPVQGANSTSSNGGMQMYRAESPIEDPAASQARVQQQQQQQQQPYEPVVRNVVPQTRSSAQPLLSTPAQLSTPPPRSASPTPPAQGGDATSRPRTASSNAGATMWSQQQQQPPPPQVINQLPAVFTAPAYPAPYHQQPYPPQPYQQQPYPQTYQQPYPQQHQQHPPYPQQQQHPSYPQPYGGHQAPAVPAYAPQQHYPMQPTPAPYQQQQQQSYQQQQPQRPPGAASDQQSYAQWAQQFQQPMRVQQQSIFDQQPQQRPPAIQQSAQPGPQLPPRTPSNATQAPTPQPTPRPPATGPQPMLPARNQDNAVTATTNGQPVPVPKPASSSSSSPLQPSSPRPSGEPAQAMNVDPSAPVPAPRPPKFQPPPLSSPVNVSFHRARRVASLDPSRSIVRDAGFMNSGGENNCFLNGILQILWHSDTFRRSILDTNHESCDDLCVVCQLKILFNKLKFSAEDKVPVIAVRVALAMLYQSESRFQMYEMDDAVECLEAILARVHADVVYRRLSEPERIKVGGPAQDFREHECHPDCPAHVSFGTRFMEQNVCFKCSDSSEPRVLTANVHYANVRELMNLPKDGRTFGQALQTCQTAEGWTCPACKTPNTHFTRTLLSAPKVLALGLAWDSAQPGGADIRQFLTMVDGHITLRDVFDTSFDRELGAKTLFLKGMVCYYGRHYVAFQLSSQVKGWMMFDDTYLKYVGDTVDEVWEKCFKGAFQPSMLLYEEV